MRLQLKQKWTVPVLVFLLIAGSVTARTRTDSLKRMTKTLQPVEFDFLAGYYEQDGDRSAVTGGEGTEELKDFATVIRINVPVRDDREVQLDSRISYFTSASSDNVDPATLSGASSDDVKIGLDATVTEHQEAKASSWSYRLGLSHEMHFLSINGGGGYRKEFKERQAEFSADIGYIMDIWGQYYDISRLYPSDYTGPDNLDRNKRHTVAVNLAVNQIVNERLRVEFGAGIIQQFGLLSTPFHRIFFADQAAIDIERLPSYRIRMPLTGGLRFYAADWLVVRSQYRFYWDNYGLKAHSVYLELPFKAKSVFSIYPFYRYHVQYGNRYFAAKGEHLSTETWYTSDYDQSDLQAHYAGGGLRWVPFSKKRTKEQRRMAFRSVEMRGAWYHRSDGFHSWIVSGGLSWSILRRASGDEHLPAP